MTLMEATEFVKCKKCGNEYPLSQFPIDARAKTGHRSICRDCFNTQQQERYAKKKQKKKKRLFLSLLLVNLFWSYAREATAAN